MFVLPRLFVAVLFNDVSVSSFTGVSRLSVLCSEEKLRRNIAAQPAKEEKNHFPLACLKY